MSQIVRCWLALAAIGSGVIHLALVVGSPLPLALILLVLGLAEITWAAAILVKDRLVLARGAWAGATIPLILWSALVVLATVLGEPRVASSLPFLPMAMASLFELFLAGVLGVQLRRRADDTVRPAAHASAVRYLAAMLVGGIIVGAMTTPALAATEAGAVALEHGGTMGGMMQMPGMDHH
jgi:hypothetical protein